VNLKRPHERSARSRAPERRTSKWCALLVCGWFACRGQPEEVRSSAARVAKPEISAAEAQAFTQGTTGFAWSLHRKLAAPGGNFVASPASIVFGLGMVEAGARGATAAQLRAAVHDGLPRAAFLNAVNRAGLELTSTSVESQGVGDKKRVDIQSINGIWAQKGFTFLPDYLDRLAIFYGAGVQLVDFAKNADAARKGVNRWVSQGTRGKINDLLGPGALSPETRLVLVNALYFWGSWTSAFDPRRTVDARFHLGSGQTVQVPTMHSAESFAYGEGEGFRMLALPYDGDSMSMYVVLPDAGKFADVTARLGTESVERVRAALRRETVELAIPKFSFAWGPSSLKEPLQSLGITDAFAAEADLSEMEAKRELRLADVMHATFIAVAEQGTEAAAATAAPSAVAGIEAASIRFAIDRPFLFFVRGTNGMILFSGQVLDPRQH
jgi:serpin B